MSSQRTSIGSDVIVFGTQDLAQLAHFYLKEQAHHRVVAFCVTGDRWERDMSFEGLPVVSLDAVIQSHPPKSFRFFVPMTQRGMNSVRSGIYRRVKDLGYSCISYVSPHATVLTEHIGENCFILEDNTIQPFVVIRDNVVMWSGNHIGHHSIIDDDAFFTSHVVLSGHCTVGRGSFFGVNSTVRDGLHIAEYTLVAQSASVVRDTQRLGVYMGVPAALGSKQSTEVM